MSFFMGYVTGPRRTGCPSGCGGARHFGHGVQACLYHELAIIGTAAVIVAASWGAPNEVGTWTFLLLWGMRQSAKRNFFLGVLNLGEQFLPPHLGYLRSFIRRKPMNMPLPVSVSAGAVIATVLVQRAILPGNEIRAAVLAFLIAMSALAVLEHWVLVLPLPFERLWSWVLRWRRPGLSRLPASRILSDAATRRGWHRVAVTTPAEPL
jgi:putative photosynthetic complex assembly protein 2